jgi:hypothetical protein
MKKSYLLEIIREEILAALNETATIDVPGDARKLTPQQKQQKINMARSTSGDRTLGSDKNPVEFVEGFNLEEDLLNETPIYNVEDMEGFKSTLDKFREEGVSKNKALNVLLTKLEDEGTVDTNSLSKEYGVDTATFNNTEIRKFLNRPEDEAFVDKKTGEELIDFTPFLGKSNKPRGPKATDKPAAEPKEPKKTEKSTTEPKKATLTKGDDDFDVVSYDKPKAIDKPETKTTDVDKASTMASKTPNLDKLAGNQDALLKTQRDVKAKMQALAQTLSGAKEAKRDEIVDELKKLNKLNGELQSKIDKLYNK